MIARLLDWVFGERCYMCQVRVLPGDGIRHRLRDCEGNR